MGAPHNAKHTWYRNSNPKWLHKIIAEKFSNKYICTSTAALLTGTQRTEIPSEGDVQTDFQAYDGMTFGSKQNEDMNEDKCYCVGD